MNFLFPWALAGLISIPILIRLWRRAVKQRRILVPSLIPFETLTRRPAMSVRRLRINHLFWLQLLALLLLVLAWTGPEWPQAYEKSVLVIMDNSASMAATDAQGNAFWQRARDRFLERLNRKAPSESWFLMAGAPPRNLMPRPTTDADELRRLIQAEMPTGVSGDLQAAYQIGTALMPDAPDQVLVVSDQQLMAGENGESAIASETLQWINVGASRPNAAIVGLQTRPPLCGAAASHLETSVANFSPSAQVVTLRASQNGSDLAEQQVHLQANGQSKVVLELPSSATGWIDLALSAAQDSLEIDNYARVLISGTGAYSARVMVEDEQKRETLQAWLQACEGLKILGGDDSETTSAGAIWITDAAAKVPSGADAFIWEGAFGTRIRTLKLMFDPQNPLGSYLAQLQPLRTILPETNNELSGRPVIWGLDEQARFPLVSVKEQTGERRIHFGFHPRLGKRELPVLTVFLNSLRWLTDTSSVFRTGEFLTLPDIPAGPVSVHIPGGEFVRLIHDGGPLTWTQTHQPGTYRMAHSGGTMEFVANPLHPKESHLQAPRLNRAGDFTGAAGEKQSVRIHRVSLLTPLLMVILILLIAEWWIYAAKGRRLQTNRVSANE